MLHCFSPLCLSVDGRIDASCDLRITLSLDMGVGIQPSNCQTLHNYSNAYDSLALWCSPCFAHDFVSCFSRVFYWSKWRRFTRRLNYLCSPRHVTPWDFSIWSSLIFKLAIVCWNVCPSGNDVVIARRQVAYNFGDEHVLRNWLA